MQKNNNGQTPKAFLTLKLDSMQTFELINALRCNNITILKSTPQKTAVFFCFSD
ncbi:unknown [Phascolarctobacterium succinatutens CAG:287]|uniref:Uncharacterized protein n=1 Tax=Phascolarctobacterium succinatutens CAG:287 TaxID=1263101 RepID=R6WLU8_9FIRM|nr:hypothetical protein [Phascolarctobacterium succinatutens]CDD12123.1 unknown [Phascolarctobacterium succinatutens CAG:287]